MNDHLNIKSALLFRSAGEKSRSNDYKYYRACNINIIYGFIGDSHGLQRYKKINIRILSNNYKMM